MITMEKLVELLKARDEALEKVQLANGRDVLAARSPEEEVLRDIDKHLASAAYYYAKKAYEDAIMEMAERQ